MAQAQPVSSPAHAAGANHQPANPKSRSLQDVFNDLKGLGYELNVAEVRLMGTKYSNETIFSALDTASFDRAAKEYLDGIVREVKAMSATQSAQANVDSLPPPGRDNPSNSAAANNNRPESNNQSQPAAQPTQPMRRQRPHERMPPGHNREQNPVQQNQSNNNVRNINDHRQQQNNVGQSGNQPRRDIDFSNIAKVRLFGRDAAVQAEASFNRKDEPVVHLQGAPLKPGSTAAKRSFEWADKGIGTHLNQNEITRALYVLLGYTQADMFDNHGLPGSDEEKKWVKIERCPDQQQGYERVRIMIGQGRTTYGVHEVGGTETLQLMRLFFDQLKKGMPDNVSDVALLSMLSRTAALNKPNPKAFRN